MPLLDNALGQADQTLTVTLSNPANTNLGAPSSAPVVIGDSETTALTVTKSADTADGACELTDCSLREAIIAANAYPGADTINLPAGTYTLSKVIESSDAFGDFRPILRSRRPSARLGLSLAHPERNSQ